MRAVLIAVIVALLQAATGATAAGQTTTKHVISLAAADRIAAAAEAEAKRRGSTVVIVVVDDGGYPIVLRRLDDAQVASVEVGIGKARTAAIFRRPSGVFEEQIRDGRLATLVLPGSTPLQGGVPILFEGRTIGAIGVSGNTPKEDEAIALAGASVAEAALKAGR
jgi:glc operon protein GlcG